MLGGVLGVYPPNPWNTPGGGQYTKQKKFPWDIFGIFGYKNVIRPGGRPRPTSRPTNFRPTPSGRPPGPNSSTWPPIGGNDCNCGWSIVMGPNGRPMVTQRPIGQTVGTTAPNNVVIGQPPGAALPPIIVTTPEPNGPPINLGGGTFNPAQQFRPVTTDLPTYFPTLPSGGGTQVRSFVNDAQWAN